MSKYWQKWGKLKLRGQHDDLPQSWWFASTAIPLLAATIGPLANVLSIAALVTKWTVNLPDNGQLPAGADNNGIPIQDPRWEIILNIISLVAGFAGNFFLLCNFTQRVRYVVALPLTVLLWFLASGILISIIIAMAACHAPVAPGQTWSQGFWHAVVACVLYFLGFGMLLINMLGYLLGKYPQRFDLNDNQRTLILQTMMFFFWLAGGAAVFNKVTGMGYANALYYCDVTILTVGFGDFDPTNNVGRGIVMPYSVLGIISLGLVINSIRKFASHMSKDRVIKGHEERCREQTIMKSVSNDDELRDRLGIPHAQHQNDHDRPRSMRTESLHSIEQYGDLSVNGRTVTFRAHDKSLKQHRRRSTNTTSTSEGKRSLASRIPQQIKHTACVISDTPTAIADKIKGGPEAVLKPNAQRLLFLKSEKDRFDAMRDVQAHTKRFKQYYNLTISIIAFLTLWCVGAVVFWRAEKREQGLSYFQALYFCYISLLTIGYGDYSPRSNAGKVFFVFWSLLAVPTITLLINDMGDTVISGINRTTSTIADWTIMPKAGVLRDFVLHHPRLKTWIDARAEEKDAKKRKERGFTVQDPDEEAGDDAADTVENPTLEKIANESLTNHELIKRLAIAIKKTAQDMRIEPPKRYSYEEWVEFTRLIRFTAESRRQMKHEEQQEGLIEWDWIGEDSPMLSDMSEPEWVLDRLIESLNRWSATQARMARQGKNIIQDVNQLSREQDPLQDHRDEGNSVQEGTSDAGTPTKENNELDLNEDIKQEENREEGDDSALDLKRNEQADSAGKGSYPQFSDQSSHTRHGSDATSKSKKPLAGRKENEEQR